MAVPAANPATSHLPACQPSWYTASITYKVRAKSVAIHRSYRYAAKHGDCWIAYRRSFQVSLTFHDRVAMTASTRSGHEFSGTQIPADGYTDTVPRDAWCARQPVTLKGLGPSPNSPRGHRVVRRHIRIRC